jgi:hypothetical protein
VLDISRAEVPCLTSTVIPLHRYTFSFNATSHTSLDALPAKHEDEVQKRAKRHAARVGYVGRYYDTKSITLPSLTSSGGEDRYDDYKPTMVRVYTSAAPTSRKSVFLRCQRTALASLWGWQRLGLGGIDMSQFCWLRILTTQWGGSQTDLQAQSLTAGWGAVWFLDAFVSTGRAGRDVGWG